MLVRRTPARHDSLTHYAIGPAGFHALKTACPERPASFRSVLIDAAYGFARAELQMDAMTAVKPDITRVSVREYAVFG